MADADKELRKLYVDASRAEWADCNTDITPEHEAAAAKANEQKAIWHHAPHQGIARVRCGSYARLDGDTQRQLLLLKFAGQPAPDDPAQAERLAENLGRNDRPILTARARSAIRWARRQSTTRPPPVKAATDAPGQDCRTECHDQRRSAALQGPSTRSAFLPSSRPAHRQVALARVRRPGEAVRLHLGWDLKLKYQGIVPRRWPAPGPSSSILVRRLTSLTNTPYMRYFLASVLQFQFHRACCTKAGFTGPLHECSIYGKQGRGRGVQEDAGDGRLRSRGRTRMYELTGQREMDASAILYYFAPLQKWLDEQNQGEQCGW